MCAHQQRNVIVLPSLNSEDDVNVGIEELVHSNTLEVSSGVEAHPVRGSFAQPGEVVLRHSAISVGTGLSELSPLLTCRHQTRTQVSCWPDLVASITRES